MNFIFKTLDPFILCIEGNELYAWFTQILTYCLIYRYGPYCSQLYMIIMKLIYLGRTSDCTIW
jgi:hypothetical protein